MALKAKKLEVKENGKGGAGKKYIPGPQPGQGACSCANWAGAK